MKSDLMNNDLNKLIDYALKKYLNDNNENNLNQLLLVLNTMCELNFNNISLDVVYILKFLYDDIRCYFNCNIQKYLENIFYLNYVRILKMRNTQISQDVNELSSILESTSNIFNNI